MRYSWLAGVLVLAVVGCKKGDKAGEPLPEKVPTPVADAAVAAKAPADAAPVADAAAAEAPEEPVLRKDRKTGLGAADEKPEVLVEELVIAIAEGKAAARFVDPARGFIEHIILPGADEVAEPDVKKRHCGKKAVETLTSYARILVAKQKQSAEQYGPEDADHVIQCDNGHLAAPDPSFGSTYDPDTDALAGGHPFRYAVCRSGGAGEYDANYELMFAPDDSLGLRVVGVLVWESGVHTVPWTDFAAQAVAPGGCK